MKKLVLQMQISVDGFVGGPNGEMEWIFKNFDDDTTAWIVDTLWQAGMHIMGRRTFHDMKAYWPRSTEPYAPPMNEIPKVVFCKNGLAAPEKVELTTAFEDASRVRGAEDGQPSSTIPASAASWDEAVVASGDLCQEIARLKQQPGKDILAHGGAGFAQSLVKAGLVDEYHLLVHPVVLGQGLPLFSSLSEPMYLQLASSTRFGGGVVAQIYRPA